jgi:hypothetical protein
MDPDRFAIGGELTRASRRAIVLHGDAEASRWTNQPRAR